MAGNSSYDGAAAGLVPDDVTAGLVHPHWLKYPPVSAEFTLAAGTVLSMSIVLSVLGNGAIILIFLRSPVLKTPANALLVNLSLCNIISSVAVSMDEATGLAGRWQFGIPGCFAYACVVGAASLSSINTMAAVALERYRVIVRSSQMKRKGKGWVHMVVLLSLVWVNSIVWVIAPIFGWGNYVLEGHGLSCTFDYLTRTNENRSFVMCLFCFGFLLPLIVILVTNASILCFVRRSRLNLGSLGRASRKRRIAKSKLGAELRIVKMIMVEVAVYCAAWVPYATVSLLGVFGNESLLTPLTVGIPSIAAKASPLFTPFVYTKYHGAFQKELRRKYVKKRSRRKLHSCRFSF
ncbi:rhodopsin, GQ-coupled-like [Lingula anatina]|uniref:Rhodopsin, GQ-coupled-like n=1 Tax=Lingula anatina TaxID=7574 RepID=A0A1S3JMQ1_LINAN|nr:rhodopsin, GQ-coupled-like [Lingula anatina]|eukprot:XP_013411648.1 rhodopsin, GQ-coupled-like [Lingula anatina]